MKQGGKGPFAGLILAVSTILFAGCGEDPRFSTQTQYLGGVYGPGPVSAAAPQDKQRPAEGSGIGDEIIISDVRCYGGARHQ